MWHFKQGLLRNDTRNIILLHSCKALFINATHMLGIDGQSCLIIPLIWECQVNYIWHFCASLFVNAKIISCIMTHQCTKMQIISQESFISPIQKCLKYHWHCAVALFRISTHIFGIIAQPCLIIPAQ